MSNTNDTNCTLVAILSVTALTYTGYYAYQFDKFKCLVPCKKDWFRVLLTWQLVMCSVGMLIWGGGWAYIKYHLGWVYFPPYGPIPYPTMLYDTHYRNLNDPFTFWVCLAYSLQVSLNAEEGLYWYHLMRAVRRPKSAKGWFNSRFFFFWIAISLVTPVALVCAGWVSYVDMDTQMARMTTVGGGIELAVLLSSAFVLLKFPEFLRDVKSSGAGPEVRSRLHFYHAVMAEGSTATYIGPMYVEANKVRTFFRFIFTACVLTMGIDGLTTAKRINLNHLASDLLNQITYLAFFFANIASVMLYLPRNWANSLNTPRQVMVGGAVPPRTRLDGPEQQEASHALLSLLREGGQWDEDDDIRAGLSMVPEGKRDEEGSTYQYGDKRGSDWDCDAEGHPGRLSANQLENWTSPFAVPTSEPKLPTDIKIHVRQEIQDDRPEQGGSGHPRTWR